MSTPLPPASTAAPADSLVTITHVVYALHTLGLVIGAFGTAIGDRHVPVRLAVDHRGDHQLREAQRRARHVARLALLVADPHVLVGDAVSQ